jgi:hypothetical protein
VTTHLLDPFDPEVRTACGVPAFELDCADGVVMYASLVDCERCMGAENKAERPISQWNDPHQDP